MVILIVLSAAAIAAIAVGALAWRLPNFDPAAPKAAGATVRREVEAHPRTASFLEARLDANAITGFGLTVALAIVLGATVAVGSLLIMVRHDSGLARWDLSAAKWGAAHATSGSTQFLRNVSQLGGTYVMIAVALVAAIVESVRTPSRIRSVFGFLTVVLAGQTALVNLTKVIVNRARPDVHRLTGFSGASFPSGHSATAAATFAAIALLVGRGRSQRVKAFLAGAAAGIAVGVAVTRVMLGVHWLTDVIAGLAMGWAWFAVASIAFGGRVLVFGQPAKTAETAAHAVDAQAGAGRASG
jgi:membrane-associated phospholipid phosphatase